MPIILVLESQNSRNSSAQSGVVPNYFLSIRILLFWIAFNKNFGVSKLIAYKLSESCFFEPPLKMGLDKTVDNN
jgi:hypothetical protein